MLLAARSFVAASYTVGNATMVQRSMERTGGWGCLLILVVAVHSAPAHGQRFSPPPGGTTRTAEGLVPVGTPSPSPARPVSTTAPVGLPNDAGQVWRTYDLRPYTSLVSNVKHPEQAVVDWILRETGPKVWFRAPLGVLNADRDQLRVYHTPQMQELVAGVVDKLVRSRGQAYVFQLRLVTVNSPNWRSQALPVMRSIPMKTPGVDAWIVSKENAALLLAGLSKRIDFRNQNSPKVVLANGQTARLSKRQPKNYVRTIDFQASGGPSVQTAQIEEGYDMDFSALVAPDEKTIDIVIELAVDQVEKFLPVGIDVPTATGTTQRLEIQVPQLVSWRLKERFRWPADHVLLLSCGVIAAPGPNQAQLFGVGIPNPFVNAAPRTDALLFIEFKGRPSDALLGTRQAAQPSAHGRY